MVPLMNEAKDAVGLTQQEMGFTCSGSSDFLAGQAFSFVMTIDGTGPVPPISESHVEQDGAWALYEAWVKLQCGDIDTAFVYSYGKSSPGSLRDVLATQMDPYYVAPLWPDAFAIEAMAARQMLEQGVVSEQQLAEIASRSARIAAEKAGVGDDKIDIAELHAPFSTSEAVLTKALGLGEDTVINPSGGAQAAHTMMASGLIRIGEAAQRISRGDADRAVATAASGPCLQQNLVAVLEGE
ncbi:MAG: hypothetical protein EBY52_01900 [Actinobacteria bacterium]|nr:hypothetical protein [Actinomycetota bacterium]